jgi:AAA ATPase domain
VAGNHIFVGRDDEFNEIAAILSAREVRSLCVEGESGCGKTALVTAVLDSLAASVDRKTMRVFLARAGHIRGLEEWLLTELAGLLLGSLPPHATAVELRQLVIDAAAGSDIVVALDNAESLDHEWLRQFITQWLVAVPQSQLLITTTRAMPLEGMVYCRYPLSGIQPGNDDAILSLLGPDLQVRFEREELLATASRLRNLPQRLLYVRWLDPSSAEDLTRVTDDLAKDVASQALIAGMRKRTGGFIGHYLALGHVRMLRFEEDLLATLWDRLGGGSAHSYVMVRNRLLKEGLLAPTSDAREDGWFRVSPSVHVQLERELASSLGKPHLPHVDYFLSEYFRGRFEDSDGSDLQHLGQYIYHSARSENLRAAAEYVLSGARLETIRRQGLTVPLRRVLLALSDEIERETVARREPRSEDLLLRCRSAVEVAASECDLSEYDKCLTTLDTLRNTLSTVGTSVAASSLRRRMNTLRGISLGCLGRLEECIRAYLAVVVEVLDDRGLDAGGVEALGYAAMVTSYIDMPRAVTLGAHSLRLANLLGDDLVIAKTRCSFAQILLYTGRIEEASDLLAQTEAYCRIGDKGDRRELGRVLIPRAFAVMATEGGKAALPVAAEAVTVNSDVGDRRRYGRACLASALATLSAGDRQTGRELLVEALNRLYSSQDWLNLVLGSFVYAHLEGMSNIATIEQFVEVRSEDELWAGFIREAISRSHLMSTLMRYWSDHYLPFLRTANIQ